MQSSSCFSSQCTKFEHQKLEAKRRWQIRENGWGRTRNGRKGRQPTTAFQAHRVRRQQSTIPHEARMSAKSTVTPPRDHSNTSTCPCSQLLQLRHRILNCGIFLPSKTDSTFVILWEWNSQTFIGPSGLFILSVRRMTSKHPSWTTKTYTTNTAHFNLHSEAAEWRSRQTEERFCSNVWFVVAL